MGEGFEPPGPIAGPPVFETGAFNQALPPHLTLTAESDTGSANRRKRNLRADANSQHLH